MPRKKPLPPVIPDDSRPVSPDGDAPTASSDGYPIVGVGASAGGLEAFTQLLAALPANPGMAFVFVQHLSPHHGSELPALLAKATTMPVVEAADNMDLRRDHVYVIPPNATLTIQDGKLTVAKRGEGPAQYLPINQFLLSLALDRKEQAIGVVLSGNASDGVSGLKAIKAEGGITFAQNEETAKFPSMPHYAAASGYVDFILAPDKIAEELTRLGNHPLVRRPVEISLETAGPTEDPPTPEADLRALFHVLRSVTGVDFSHYKLTTIKRRIARRMKLCQAETLAAYVARLKASRGEVEALHDDLLIPVTAFFRDAECLETVKRVVLDEFINQSPTDRPLRIWVVGCSTGEEAYSIAITALECAHEMSRAASIQLFATDVNGVSVERARQGLFPKEIEAEVSAERLARFFIQTESGYQIAKSVRDVCIFARQNVISDPPFSHVDLISCRNVFIYFDTVLQRKVLQTFHYALNPNGYLLLGNTESVGVSSDLFALVDKKSNLYRKKTITSPTALQFQFSQRDPAFAPDPPAALRGAGSNLEVLKEADRLALARYSPAGVVVTAQLDIVQFRGSTGGYLEPSPGVASLNLLKMARPGLLPHLTEAIQEARETLAPVRRAGVKFEHVGQFRTVTLVVIPLGDPTTERHFLVLFESNETAKVAATPRSARKPPPEWELERERLNLELVKVKEYLQSVIEEQVAANEEAQSSNEELQSLNEELETAKEELQSTNEELITVNDELQARNNELAQLNNDLNNLLGNVEIGFLVLDLDLRIRRFTPMAGRMLNLIPTDVGRPIGNMNPNLNLSNMSGIIDEVLNRLESKELEVRDNEGRWYSLRIKPYQTLDRKIAGVVLALVEIDLLKRSLEIAENARDFSNAIIETIRTPLLVLNGNFQVVRANSAFAQAFGITHEDAVNRSLDELGEKRWDLQGLQKQLEEILPGRAVLQDFELPPAADAPDRRALRLNARRLDGTDGQPASILLAFEVVAGQ